MTPTTKPQVQPVDREEVLLPCPWCGGPASLKEDIDYHTGDPTGLWWVQCDPCDAFPESVWRKQKCEAVAAWNTRHREQALSPDAIIALGDLGRREGVPNGWALVPVEPTPEMLEAGWLRVTHELAHGHRWALPTLWAAMLAAVSEATVSVSPATYRRGDRVEKISGSSWHGIVVGTYFTSLTPEGYNVESEREPGSVQLYPVGALRPATGEEVS